MKWYAYDDYEEKFLVYLKERARNFASLSPEEPHVIHPEVLYKVMAKFALQEVAVDRRRNRRARRNRKGHLKDIANPS